ncbi:MAG TPA: hypothetical protein PKE64_01430 [Anaerolineae bacterium]|nr:hypothetical protein [Anaerolineae bacterium]HMR62648.1 hypothetical protein [Anaerolineae bacterium]
MINLISAILTIYIWGLVCVLIFFLFAIGRFYEQKSGHRSFYQLFLIPIVAFLLATIPYVGLAPLLVGNFFGDLLRFFGGMVLGGVGVILLRMMIGGRS